MRITRRSFLGGAVALVFTLALGGRKPPPHPHPKPTPTPTSIGLPFWPSYAEAYA